MGDSAKFIATSHIPVVGAPMAIRDAVKKDGGGSSGASITQAPDLNAPRNPPGLFEPYNKYIPQAMNSNGPITDPSAILQAYQQNLPEFRLAAQGPPGAPPVSESLSSRQPKK